MTPTNDVTKRLIIKNIIVSPFSFWFMMTLKSIVLFFDNVVFKVVSANIIKYFFTIFSSFTMSISWETSKSFLICAVIVKHNILVVMYLNSSLSFAFSSSPRLSNLIFPLPKYEVKIFQKLSMCWANIVLPPIFVPEWDTSIKSHASFGSSFKLLSSNV